MKPVLTTPERLMLRSRPWVMGIGLIAAMLLFAAIGLAKLAEGDTSEAGKLLLLFGLFAVVFAVFVRQVVVIFDRAADTVVIRSASVFGARESSHPLTGLIEVRLEQNSDSSGSNRPLLRPVLAYRDGSKVPLNPIYQSGDNSAQVAKAVNVWLAGKA